jgi:hypothetical protein
MVLGGQDNRPLHERTLALGRFIASQRGIQGKRSTLRCLQDEWNRSYPQWAYARVSHFAKDVNRAEQALRFPCPHRDIPLKAAMGTGIAWAPFFHYLGIQDDIWKKDVIRRQRKHRGKRQ